jgi:glycosyltransferase involved in cell wall biosynthesis
VLSWSLLEAMSCGALVIGSATAPVQEVMGHGRNGLLVPFADAAALADTLLQALQPSPHWPRLRQQARSFVANHYPLDRCLKRRLQCIDQLLAG